jgi:hypothetical protein
MRESTTLTLDQRGLRHRLARLRPRAAAGAQVAAARFVVWTAHAVECLAVAGGWVLLPVLPLAAAAAAREPAFARRYGSTLAQLTRHIRATWRGRSISRMLVQRFTPASLREPRRILGSCTHCGNCCLFRSCVFLRFDAQGQSRCRIYGGRLWKHLSCGSYPLDAREIELYACPSFKAVASRYRVVPLVAAGAPPGRDA